MTAELQAKLARLHNRQTRYELVAFCADRGAILIGYTHNRSRRGLMKMLRMRVTDGTFGLLFDTSEITFAKRAADGGTIGNWQVRFSGRTQRDAYLNGELEFIGDLTGKYAATDLIPQSA